MTWFKQLFGFKEPTQRADLHQRLQVEGAWLYDKKSERRWRCGHLEVATLAELQTRATPPQGGRLMLREVVADVQALHGQYPNAVFQAASQFNLLEMASPKHVPEDGIGIYSYDHTQGPACAIACGAGTVYRNYFVPLEDQLGQTTQRQINTLAPLEAALNNAQHRYWTLQNGYQKATPEAVKRLAQHLSTYAPAALEALGGQLQVGLQWDTQVTWNNHTHTVTQVYCSGVPIGYNTAPVEAWVPFAPMVLNATYEATFWAAWEQYQRTGVGQLFLTLVGGGVFQNPLPWVVAAIERSLKRFAEAPLEVHIVSYGQSQPLVRALVDRWNNATA